MSRPDPTTYLLPLDREAFDRAVRLGLGRAHLHVQRHGIGHLGELVLGACLRNDVYDRQCEAARAPYLLRLACSAGIEALLRTRLLESAPQADDGNSGQIADFHIMLAKNGSMPSREWLYTRVEETRRPLESCQWNSLIELDGIDAAVRVVRSVGDFWASAIEAYWAVRNAARDTGTDFGTAMARFEAFAHEPKVAAFLDLVRSHDPRPLVESAAHVDLEGQAMHAVAKRAGLRCKPFRSSVSKALRCASDEQLEAFGREIAVMACTDAKLANALVRVVPRGRTPASLIDFHLARVRAYPPTTEGQDQPGVLSWQSALRLGEVADPRVEQLAIETYRAGYRDAAIAMLESGYRAEHEPMLWDTIDTAEGVYDLHFVLSQIIDIFHERDNLAPRRELLLHAYAYSPCTHCRCRAVEALRATDELPDHIEAEWPYDAQMLRWDKPDLSAPAT